MRSAAALLALAAATFATDPKVELGRRLFMDPTVSRGGKFACASCHDPEHGFSDPRPLSEDENGRTRRHSQPLLDLAASQPLHWDGEFGSLNELLTARLGAPEQAFELARRVRERRFEEARAAGLGPDRERLRRKLGSLRPPYYGDGGNRPVPVLLERWLATDNRYASAFALAFGDEQATTDRVVDALEAYLLSIRTGRSGFDRDRSWDPDGLTEEGQRGLALFTGKAGCVSCHVIEGNRPTLTDGQFHNTGVAFRVAELDFDGTVKADGGAGELTLVREDLGRFKTPSLRDVALRAPYMHDGSLPTLEAVVRYYDGGGTSNAHLDPRVHRLGLSDADVRDLVAFLEALTSHERPGLGVVPDGPRHARVRVLDIQGNPMWPLKVEVRAAGDRLRGTGAPASQVLTTDSKGFIAFDFPAWTHVRLVSDAYEIHYDWPIPDCVTSMDVMAASRSQVAVLLAFRRPPEKFLAGEVLFTRARLLDGQRGIYLAARRDGDPLVASPMGLPDLREFDLSGGWAEPLDLRPG